MIKVPSSTIGVVISICGNIVISLALNCQKLAHARLGDEEERSGSSTPKQDGEANVPLNSNHVPSKPTPIPPPPPSIQIPTYTISPKSTESPPASVSLNDSDLQYTYIPRVEVQPPTPRSDSGYFSHHIGNLLTRQNSKGSVKSFGASGNLIIFPGSRVKGRRWSGLSNTLSSHQEEGQASSTEQHDDEADDESKDEGRGNKTYLGSKLWWAGLLLMAIGEAGNFLSYGFAPASVVAPLGTVALIANCIFAPLMLHEKIRWRDLAGVFLAILGAVTVVLSAKQQDKQLDPDGLIQAITQKPFIAYSVTIVVMLLVLLAVTNSERYGNKVVVVDVLICALFGGFTVLSTKALSGLLSSIFVKAFRYPITWVLIVVLAVTSIEQIKYLNKALKNFESKEVIPAQFVFFSISAIVGSAVLYQEFRDVTASQFANFLFGVATTFTGVFLLTYRKDDGDNDNDSQSDQQQQQQQDHITDPSSLQRLASLPEEQPLIIPVDIRPNYAAIPADTRKLLRKRSSTTSLHRHGLVGGGYLLIGSSPPNAAALARSLGDRSRSSSRAGGPRDRNVSGSYDV